MTNQGAIFLDRDGVINASPANRYVTRWEQFRFLPGALEALRRLNRHRCRVIVVSNQSAVGRGILSRRELYAITQQMLQVVRAAGGRIDAVYTCPHPPENGCRCRKPRTGLLKKACREWGIDLARSVVVGDDESDIRMGRAAGCRTILVLSGKSLRKALKRFSVPPDRISKDLREAVRWILKHRSSKAP